MAAVRVVRSFLLLRTALSHPLPRWSSATTAHSLCARTLTQCSVLSARRVKSRGTVIADSTAHVTVIDDITDAANIVDHDMSIADLDAAEYEAKGERKLWSSGRMQQGPLDFVSVRDLVGQPGITVVLQPADSDAADTDESTAPLTAEEEVEYAAVTAEEDAMLAELSNMRVTGQNGLTEEMARRDTPHKGEEDDSADDALLMSAFAVEDAARVLFAEQAGEFKEEEGTESVQEDVRGGQIQSTCVDLV